MRQVPHLPATSGAHRREGKPQVKLGKLTIEKRSEAEQRKFIAEQRRGPDGAAKFGEKTLKKLDKKK